MAVWVTAHMGELYHVRKLLTSAANRSTRAWATSEWYAEGFARHDPFA